MGRASDDPSRGHRPASPVRATPDRSPARAFRLVREFPRSPIAVLVVVATILSTASVSIWVAGHAGATDVAIADWGGPSYAQDVGRFHPVTRRLITDVARSP